MWQSRIKPLLKSWGGAVGVLLAATHLWKYLYRLIDAWGNTLMVSEYLARAWNFLGSTVGTFILMGAGFGLIILQLWRQNRRTQQSGETQPEMLAPPVEKQEGRIKELEQIKAAPQEPVISGTIDEAFFLSLNHDSDVMNLFAALKVRLKNDGIPTQIQGFRLGFVLFGKEYRTYPCECTSFRIDRGRDAYYKQVVEELNDLRDKNPAPFERQFPREGWLCFDVRNLPPIAKNMKRIEELRLDLWVIDGADKGHLITGAYPFKGLGSLVMAKG